AVVVHGLVRPRPGPAPGGRGPDPLDVVVADREHDVGGARVGPTKPDRLDARAAPLAVGGPEPGPLVDRDRVARARVVPTRLRFEPVVAAPRGATRAARALRLGLGDGPGVLAPALA